MKQQLKMIKYYLIIFLCGALLAGCDKKDKEEEETLVNQFIYDGEKFDVIGGAQFFYGHYEDYGDKANNIWLALRSDDMFIGLDMFVPNGKNKLVDGSYHNAQSFEASTIAVAGVFNNDREQLFEITSATVVISVSGNTYTIDITGTLDDGKSIKGNYTGELEWYDES